MLPGVFPLAPKPFFLHLLETPSYFSVNMIWDCIYIPFFHGMHAFENGFHDFISQLISLHDSVSNDLICFWCGTPSTS